MVLDNYYYYFKSALTPKFCSEVIEYGNSHQDNIAKTANFTNQDLSNKELKNLQKKRNSNVAWLDDFWIYKEILPYVEEANEKAGWNFNINCAEACQFTKYGPGQYYGWHFDSYPKPYNKPENKHLHNKIRKISVTCNLTDPNNYIGGELEFNLNNPENKKKDNYITCTEAKFRGSIIVFPSFVWHRVKPVLTGKRYSLVIWTGGESFK